MLLTVHSTWRCGLQIWPWVLQRDMCCMYINEIFPQTQQHLQVGLLAPALQYTSLNFITQSQLGFNSWETEQECQQWDLLWYYSPLKYTLKL